jgi:hypothetical protein
MIADPPPGAPLPPILPPVNGFLLLDRDKFAASFAADVPAKLAAFMADSQLPAAVDALSGAVTEPAWRSKPSWYLVATDDRMIPPAAQRAMSERAKATVTETPGSHAVYVSRPAVVAAVISQAAQGRLPGFGRGWQVFDRPAAAGYIGCRYIGLRSNLQCMTDSGIAGDVTCQTAHPCDATAAEGAEASRPRRRRLPQGALALAVALVVAIGGLIAIVTFLAPLASAAGGCGGG